MGKGIYVFHIRIVDVEPHQRHDAQKFLLTPEGKDPIAGMVKHHPGMGKLPVFLYGKRGVPLLILMGAKS